ncbi:MAG TPA: hypothetical protein VEG08_14970 [Terriglobales bacterium]|nr:hypothetical protein [Terriglobales bacterium]
MRRALIAVLLLAGCALPAVAKKPKWALTRQPPKTVEIAGLAVTPAAQKCANWAWAAGMADMLRLRGLPLKPEDLVLKAYAGTVCDDRLGDLERLAQVAAGEYRREDGSKVRVESRFTPGLSAPDDLVAGVLRRQPLLLIWRGHPYLVRGVTYVEAIAQNGQKSVEIREILLADSFAPGAQGQTTFQAGRDDPAEVDGMMDVTVTPEAGNDWLRQPTDWLHQNPK